MLLISNNDVVSLPLGLAITQGEVLRPLFRSLQVLPLAFLLPSSLPALLLRLTTSQTPRLLTRPQVTIRQRSPSDPHPRKFVPFPYLLSPPPYYVETPCGKASSLNSILLLSLPSPPIITIIVNSLKDSNYLIVHSRTPKQGPPPPKLFPGPLLYRGPKTFSLHPPRSFVSRWSK